MALKHGPLFHELAVESMVSLIVAVQFTFMFASSALAGCTRGGPDCALFFHYAIALGTAIGAWMSIGFFILPGVAWGWMNFRTRKLPDYAVARMTKLKIWSTVNLALVVAVCLLTMKMLKLYNSVPI